MEWTKNLMFERVGLPWILSRRIQQTAFWAHGKAPLPQLLGNPGPREAELQVWSGDLHSTWLSMLS